MVWDSEWPESAQCESVSLSLVVPGEIDVLPAERGEVLEQLGIDRLTVAGGALDRPFDVGTKWFRRPSSPQRVGGTER
jgi:hypothetical protein